MARSRRKIPTFFTIEIGPVRGIAEAMDDAQWGKWSKKALDDMSIGCIRKDTDPRVKEVFDTAKSMMDAEYQRKHDWYEAQKAQETTADGDIREDSHDGKSGTSANTNIAKPTKNAYGEFGNVKMTTAEFEKFVQVVGADRANALIEELSSYLASSGKRYKSHYATLLNWCRRKDKEGEPKQKFLTADDISRRNIEESKRQLDELMAHRRATHG